MVEQDIERQRAAMDLAGKYADNPHNTADFIKFYESIDPKVYEDMSRITEFSDEQEHLAKSVYESKEAGALETPKDAAIFDVACGTGMLGKLLQAQGYTNITGADATPNFVKVSKESGIYVDVFEHWFGMGVDRFPEEHKERYDVVTASGCLSKGHIPNSGIDDIHLSLKVGGYFCAGWRTFYLTPGEENGFYEKLEAMVAEGKFTLVRRYEFLRGLTGKRLDEQVRAEYEKGIKRFQQASSTITVYQKTA